MDKKYLYIIIVLLIISLITLYFLLNPNNITCESKEKKVFTLLEKANYCKVDTDCEVNTEFLCPFGCYSLVNKNVDLNQIRELISDYENHCLECKYKCGIVPKKEEIRCIDGKCMELRYR